MACHFHYRCKSCIHEFEGGERDLGDTVMQPEKCPNCGNTELKDLQEVVGCDFRDKIHVKSKTRKFFIP